MPRYSAALLCLSLLGPSSWGQTASDLAQKYPHHVVYEVEPGVQMSARFASDGLVCEMRVEQTHFKTDTVALHNGIERDKIDALVDRLVSPSERGERAPDDLRGSMIVAGGGMEITDRYANVDVTTMWGVESNKKHKRSLTAITGAVIEIKWRNRSCS